jgi:EmrB/QacA subfamily drug resistance transporter
VKAPPGARLALLASTQLVIALDYNIVYVALPDIAAALELSAQSVQWVVSAYAVGLGGLLLLGGRAVDRLGARRLFIVGLALYGVASLIGGFSDTAGLLIAARAVQGIGGAMLTPATLALIFIGFAEGPERNRAMAAWGMGGSAGLAAGSLLGGVLTEYLGWQSVFFVNVPLALGAAWLGRSLLPADPARTSGLRGFDLPGALLATAGSSLLVFGLVSGSEAGWTSARTLGTLAAGIVLLAVLAIVEGRTADPLIPLRLVRGRNLATTMAVIAVFQATLGGGFYVLTTYLQPVLGYSALEAGLAFLPLTLVCMFAALKLIPPVIARWGVRATLTGSLLGTGAGIALVGAGMSADGSFWAILPGTLVWGLFGGLAFVTLFVSAGTGVAPAEQGIASGLATTAQQIGGAMGLAAIIAVLTASGADDLLGGLHRATWTAAVATAAAALLALALPRPVNSVSTPKEEITV